MDKIWNLIGKVHLRHQLLAVAFSKVLQPHVLHSICEVCMGACNSIVLAQNKMHISILLVQNKMRKYNMNSVVQAWACILAC